VLLRLLAIVPVLSYSVPTQLVPQLQKQKQSTSEIEVKVLETSSTVFFQEYRSWEETMLMLIRYESNVPIDREW
jgi:hypothetical protein